MTACGWPQKPPASTASRSRTFTVRIIGCVYDLETSVVELLI
jgi:hypothetical protein